MEKQKQYNSTGKDERSSAADFTLLFNRLEHELLKAEETARSKAILSNSRFWKRLSSDQMLKWAELCQMAGLIDQAIAIYGHLNQNAPEFVSAWRDHLELLSIAGRRENAVQVLAAAKTYLPAADYQYWLESFQDNKTEAADDGLQAAATPFLEMRRRQDRIERFLSLFAGREDVFARQWADRSTNRQGYVPVRRPMTRRDVSDHLKGQKTYGIYLLDSAAEAGLAVIDADLKADFRSKSLSAAERHQLKRERGYMVQRIKEAAHRAGGLPVIEYSGGKGYHFWFFYGSRVPAGTAKDFVQWIKDQTAPDLRMFNLEVFPKQRHLSGKGLGNLVKLPLGVHRVTGKRSVFLECRDRGMDAQLDFLAAVKPISVDDMKTARQTATREKVIVHPRWEKWAAEYPELYALEVRCPPIGRLIAACRERNALNQREEKVLFQTIGFLPRGRQLMHYLLAFDTEYNPHLVDYKLSRIRGTPLGCRRIHSLLEYPGDYCQLPNTKTYPHPLLHLDEWQENGAPAVNERAADLSQAIEHLRTAITEVESFLTSKK